MSPHPTISTLYDDLQTEVHVWFCQPPLIQDKVKLSGYEKMLSKPEVEKYQRMHFAKDRHSYLVSHALLRQSLSKYAGIPAALWQFESNEYGKPQLKSSPFAEPLYFNLSHTDGLSACVISLNASNGIDVENTHRNNNLAAVARRMFAAEELALLDMQNITPQFYYLWTLREAYVKALGTGLAGSATEFYFEINKNDLSVTLCEKKRLKVAEINWQFSLHEPTPAHVLALAFEVNKSVPVLLNEFIP